MATHPANKQKAIYPAKNTMLRLFQRVLADDTVLHSDDGVRMWVCYQVDILKWIAVDQKHIGIRALPNITVVTGIGLAF
jgi:hypothetical protein